MYSVTGWFQCVYEPHTKKIRARAPRNFVRNSEKFVRKRERWKTGGWKRAWSLSTVLRGYGQKMWDNVSQWSVRPSINPNCSLLVKLRRLYNTQDKRVGHSFTRPVRGECCILQNGRALHTCRYMLSSAIIYILSIVSGHRSGTWSKGV